MAIRTNVVLTTHCLLIFHIWSTKFFTILFTGKVGGRVILVLIFWWSWNFSSYMVSSCSILFTYFKTVFAFALRPFLPMWTASAVGQQHLVLYCNYNGDITPKFDLVKTDWGVHSIKGQRAWTASVMIFLGIPHLTIFSTLKYPCQICQIWIW